MTVPDDARASGDRRLQGRPAAREAAQRRSPRIYGRRALDQDVLENEERNIEDELRAAAAAASAAAPTTADPAGGVAAGRVRRGAGPRYPGRSRGRPAASSSPRRYQPVTSCVVPASRSSRRGWAPTPTVPVRCAEAEGVPGGGREKTARSRPCGDPTQLVVTAAITRPEDHSIGGVSNSSTYRSESRGALQAVVKTGPATTTSSRASTPIAKPRRRNAQFAGLS